MEKTICFTDGASRGNPGPAGWGFILATDDAVVEKGGFIKEGTNNQAELTAVCEALELAKEKDITELFLYTDSAHIRQGADSWLERWQRDGWETKGGKPIKNKQLWQRLSKLQSGLNVTYEQVRAHAGIPANERADDIATAFADGTDSKLFSGPRDEYETNLEPSVEYIENAPVYLSLVDGEVAQHETWSECQSRVKGVPGAKFKKIHTISQREGLLSEWGIEAGSKS